MNFVAAELSSLTDCVYDDHGVVIRKYGLSADDIARSTSSPGRSEEGSTPAIARTYKRLRMSPKLSHFQLASPCDKNAT